MCAQGSVEPTSRKTARLSRSKRTAILKAIADPNRFELLERVARAARELGCADLRGAFQVAPATLSHHIKELESARLIQVRREGKFMYLSPRPGTLEDLIETLEGLRAACPDRYAGGEIPPKT